MGGAADEVGQGSVASQLATGFTPCWMSRTVSGSGMSGFSPGCTLPSIGLTYPIDS
jgi:hypothetical protein